MADEQPAKKQCTETVGTKQPCHVCSAVVERILAENVAVEDERDALKAEVSRMKRKYEPEGPEIVADQTFRLSNNISSNLLDVQIYTGPKLVLTLIPRERNNGNVPDWRFPGPGGVENAEDNVHVFRRYGKYSLYIGDGTAGHACLVDFNERFVRITEPDFDSTSWESRLVIQAIQAGEQGAGPDSFVAHVPYAVGEGEGEGAGAGA